jgi:L-lactate dehydrogenase complex protein LldG
MSNPNVSTGIMTGREAFIKNIANRLGRKSPLTEAPERPVIGVPEHYKAIALTQEENVRLFIESWTALNGKVLVVKQEEAAQAIRAWLKELLRELQVSRAARWEHEELAALKLDDWMRQEGIQVVPWREREDDPFEPAASAEAAAESNWAKRSPLLKAVERCQMGIVWPDYAIANTGTLALLARGGKGRSVSLVTDILFAIFRADQLVTRMGQALERIRERHPDPVSLPSSLNFITGPSRSADIENDLTIGIHGPGKVYAVIIE